MSGQPAAYIVLVVVPALVLIPIFSVCGLEGRSPGKLGYVLYLLEYCLGPGVAAATFSETLSSPARCVAEAMGEPRGCVEQVVFVVVGHHT